MVRTGQLQDLDDRIIDLRRPLHFAFRGARVNLLFGGEGRSDGQEFNGAEVWRVGALRALASWQDGGGAWQSHELCLEVRFAVLPGAGTDRFLPATLPALRLSILGAGVDRRLMGTPPFPRKKAERMGQGSLSQKPKCFNHLATPARLKSGPPRSTIWVHAIALALRTIQFLRRSRF